MKVFWPLVVRARRHPKPTIAITVAALVLLMGGIGSALSPQKAASTSTVAPAAIVTTAPAAPSAIATRTLSPSPTPSPAPKPAPAPSTAPTPMLVTTATGDIEPNRTLTPGEAFPAATAAQVCVSGYSASVRNVPESRRHQVFAAYGINYATHANYELDHLISLELGGDNSAANLWPEPLNGAGGAKVKDTLENKLHSLVCSGQLTLVTAQQAISGDWGTAFAQYEGTAVAPAQAPSYTAPAPAYTAPAPAGGADVYYANCAAARAAGAAPISAGQPGYRAGLDRDGDGIACET